MANPQPTDAHLRVAHSINEAIMLRDFTKRQRKILDLILRLSWGCGKKTAIIPFQRDFSIVGVGETHIVAELRWLVSSQVIMITGNEYSFNKDFDTWKVSFVKPFNPEALTKLVSINLNHTYQNGKLGDVLLTKTVSPNLPKQEVKTYQNSKFPTPNLASRKEILNKYIYKDNIYPSIIKDLTPELTETVRMAREVWEKALIELKGQVNAQNYRTWLEKTTGVFVDGGILVVGVPSLNVLEHLAKTQMSLIGKVLMELGDYQVQFIIQGANDATDWSKNTQHGSGD